MVNISVTERDGRQVVSARELYDFLGLDVSNWKRWYQKNIEKNDFAVENTDYEGFVIMTNGNETKDFALTIDFAKRLAMMARTEKGEQARQYFLECERKLKDQQPVSLPSTKQLALMVIAAEEAKEKAQQELSEAKHQLQIEAPKVVFANAILGSRTSCLVQELAKIITQNGYVIGQNRLFKWLRQFGYLGQKGERWNVPNQKYIELGYFEIKKGVRNGNDGVLHTTITTKVTPKGQQYFINKFLSAKLQTA